jgi:hypothetical protein
MLWLQDICQSLELLEIPGVFAPVLLVDSDSRKDQPFRSLRVIDFQVSPGKPTRPPALSTKNSAKDRFTVLHRLMINQYTLLFSPVSYNISDLPLPGARLTQHIWAW